MNSIVDTDERLVNILELQERCGGHLEVDESISSELCIVVKLYASAKQRERLYLNWVQLHYSVDPDSVLERHVNMHLKELRKYEYD